MKPFLNKISLVKNGRGCYILDTIKGCSVCNSEKPGGCYGDCYAKRISGRYGFDFGNPIKRVFDKDSSQLSFFGFTTNYHIDDIVSQIKNIDMPFIRIGDMGDPSEDWYHTIGVCKNVARAGKPIVIITKHWKQIPDSLLCDIKEMNICINTSISALDSDAEIQYRLGQYNRLKNYCNSVLRIVSCDFNMENNEGKTRSVIQEQLFKNEKVIDTVFRPSKNNPLVLNGIINTKKVKFLKSNVLASLYKPNTYLGDCGHCPDLCGIIYN